MTSKEFWEYDPELFNVYRTLFINKKKRQLEENNYNSWLQGLYIHKGNSILTSNLSVSISKMLGDKQSKYSKETYPEKPFELFKEEEEKKKQLQKQKQKQEYQSNLNFYGSMKRRYKEKLSKKGE